MAKCHICIQMLENIVALQTKSDASLHEIKTLWQKFYSFSQKYRSTIRKELWGLDGFRYLTILNKALSQPVYADGATHRLGFVEHQNLTISDLQTYTQFTKEQRETFIKLAMMEALEYLEFRYGIQESSSLYQCCQVTSSELAANLKSPGSSAQLIDVRDVFSTSIPHAFCYATFMGDDGFIHPYVIDMTFKQFYTLANCMPESRHLISEGALDPIRRMYHKHYIAPGFFSVKENFLKHELLLEKGFFNDLSSLEMYGNSFYKAGLSRENGDIVSLVSQRKSGEEYFDSLKKKIGGKR